MHIEVITYTHNIISLSVILFYSSNAPQPTSQEKMATLQQRTKYALKILVLVLSCCLVIGLLLSLLSSNKSSSTSTSILAMNDTAVLVPCTQNRAIDVVICLDSDFSLGATNWILVKQFASTIVSNMNVSQNGTR